MIVVDVGNTKTAIGCFKDDHLAGRWQMGTDAGLSVEEYHTALNEFLSTVDDSLETSEDLVLASVVPAVTEEMEKIRETVNLHVVSHRTPLSYEIAIPKPETLGADRIADLEGAVRKYGAPVIVIDTGTATTINVVNSDYQFIGGIIAPGVGTSMSALHSAAAKLTPSRLPETDSVIGNTTEEAMAIGLLHGHAAMINGLLAEIQDELNLGDVPIIARGGSLESFSEHLSPGIHVDQLLLLDGLKFIHQNITKKGTGHA